MKLDGRVNCAICGETKFFVHPQGNIGTEMIIYIIPACECAPTAMEIKAVDSHFQVEEITITYLSGEPSTN